MVDNDEGKEKLEVNKVSAAKDYVAYCKEGFSDNIIFGTIFLIDTLVATYLAIADDKKRAFIILYGIVNLVLSIICYYNSTKYKKRIKETEEELRVK